MYHAHRIDCRRSHWNRTIGSFSVHEIKWRKQRIGSNQNRSDTDQSIQCAYNLRFLKTAIGETQDRRSSLIRLQCFWLLKVSNIQRRNLIFKYRRISLLNVMYLQTLTEGWSNIFVLNQNTLTYSFGWVKFTVNYKTNITKYW